MTAITQPSLGKENKYSGWDFNEFLIESQKSGFLYENVPEMDGMSGSRIQRNGKELINFCGINFLDLQKEEKVMNFFCQSARKYGLATGGSRLTQGVNLPHRQLEQKMNQIFQKPYTLTFGTGLLANQGFVNAMTAKFEFNSNCGVDNRDTVFVLDRDSHFSLWNAALKLSYGHQLFAFRHNDPEDLERVLRKINSRKSVVVFETVYSSDGSVAPIGQLLDVCDRYEALSYVDDANGFMIYGSHKRPFYQEYQALSRVDFIMVSFSKAIGLEGGAISGPTEFVKSFEMLSGTSLFTATMQPPTAATALEIIHELENHPEIMDNYLQRGLQLRETLLNLGFHLNGDASYITSILIGRDEVAEQVRRELLERGYCVPVFRYPAVKRGQALIRLMLNNRHTEEEINGFIEVLKKMRERYKF